MHWVVVSYLILTRFQSTFPNLDAIAMDVSFQLYSP